MNNFEKSINKKNAETPDYEAILKWQKGGLEASGIELEKTETNLVEEKNIEIEEKQKGDKEKLNKERLGVEESKDLKTTIGKGLFDTLGSVFGFRSIKEVPKLINEYFTKKEQRGNIDESVKKLLIEIENRKNKDWYKEQFENKKEGEEESRPISLRIKELNERLKDPKMSIEEKTGMRKAMADILKEHRNESKNIETSKDEKVKKVLDLYINNSAQTITAAREVLNTASIMAMVPWIRLYGYAAFSGIERMVKASNQYDKEHLNDKVGDTEKLGFLVKDLTVNSTKETYNGLIGNFFNKDSKKTKLQKAGEFSSSVFKLIRVAGLVEFENQLQSGSMPIQEGAKKFWDAVANGNFSDVIKQGGDNILNNAQKYLSFIGLSENPQESVKELVDGNKSSAGLFIFSAKDIPEETKLDVVEIKENIINDNEELGSAMIRKGEGITHALVRQLKSDPKSFGFEGDENNTIELHRWAQQKSYDLAVENDFINPEKGVEVRVVFDKDNPSGYFLHKDGFIEKIKLNNSENFESVSSVAPETEIKHVDDDEYAWSVGKQIKSDLEEAKIREDLAISEFNKADISSEPSSVEDVRKEINEVPKTVLEENEEVENLKEEMPEQAEKIETEKEEIKNIEKNTEVNNLEKESKIENELINSGAKTETINLSKFSKVVFKFNKDNKVSDVLIPTRELDYYSNEDANANFIIIGLIP